jgi:hypothetical protein
MWPQLKTVDSECLWTEAKENIWKRKDKGQSVTATPLQCLVLYYATFGIRQKASPDTIKIRVERALAYESTEFEVNE